MFSVDIEPTNRCNAKCHFCPRDQTPHQGLMTQEVFDQSLLRAIELRDDRGQDFPIQLCGLGEPLLNPRTPDYVRQVREAGFKCGLSSNASILDERKARKLLDAGLSEIAINAGDEGEEYEDVYKLPFEKTRDNIIRFNEMASDDCNVQVVLVDHRYDAAHIEKMKTYWRGFGIEHFIQFDIINRGGALFVDHMQYETYSQIDEARALFDEHGLKPGCAAPFLFLFVGYDGNYYLCCSDWKKEAPVGTVFDHSFHAVTKAKIDHVLSREPVCKTCNLDSLNKLTEVLRAIETGEADPSERDEIIKDLKGPSSVISAAEQQVAAGDPSEWAPAKRRRPIPVTVTEA